MYKKRNTPINITKGSILFSLIFLAAYLSADTLTAQEYALRRVANLYPLPGLSEIKINNHILQDNSGILWANSPHGIIKFDGYEITKFTFNPEHPNKLAGNWTSTLTNDEDGNIWIGIFGIGLQKLNLRTGHFTTFQAHPEHKDSLHSDLIQSLVFQDSILWIRTQVGISCLSISSGKFKRYNVLASRHFLPHVDGQIWAMSGNKILQYEPKLDSFLLKHTFEVGSSTILPIAIIGDYIYLTIDGFLHILSLSTRQIHTVEALKNYPIEAVSFDGQDILMIGNEVIVYNPNSGIKYLRSLNSTFIAEKDFSFTRIFRLSNGDICVRGDKLYTLKVNNPGIETFELLQDGKRIKPGGRSALSEIPDGKLMIGYNIILDFNIETVLEAESVFPALGLLKEKYAWSKDLSFASKQDELGNIWMACRSAGSFSLYNFSPSQNKLNNLGAHKAPINMMDIEKIETTLWIGGWAGLIRWDIPTSTFKFYKAGIDSTSLSSQNIRNLFRDKDDGLWIATQNGLNYKRKDQEFFHHYKARHGDTNKLTANSISGLNQDDSGTMWVGTLDGGLNKLNIQTGNFTWLTTSHGLHGVEVDNILIDDFNKIWTSHENGLSRTDPITNYTENFTYSEIVRDDHLENASCTMTDGSLVFIGDYITRVLPNGLFRDTFEPPLLITSFKLHNTNVEVNSPDSILQQQIYLTNEIVLKHHQNVMSFTYAALDFSNTKDRKYAYQLVGFDQEWQFVDQKREVTFTNLPHGSYTLRIKSANQNGVWHEMKTPLTIIILPPWWLTWLAYTVYALTFVSALWWFIQSRSRRLREVNIVLEQKVEKRTQELSSSLEELKSTQAKLVQREKMAALGELTAGIAHEIQNPLNFVNNFSEVNKELLEEMQQSIENKDLNEIKTLSQNVVENEEKIILHGKRADAIVKSMLQHSRTSTGKKELTDINALADEYLRLSYHGLRAKDKTFNAEFHIDLDKDLPKVEVIAQDIGRVLLNLINNAFYACTEKSRQSSTGSLQPAASSKKQEAFLPKVIVTTKSLGNSIEIRVRDNGMGIPSHIKDKIFQPFFTTKPTGQGTGLGLSLSYDIVKAHGGEINMHSEEGEGTEFIITLPLE